MKIEFNDFISRLDREVLSEYEFNKLTYNGVTKKIEITHLNCDNIFYMTPKNFLKGQRCPKCAQIKRNNSLIKTDENLKNEIGDRFKILEYNGKTKINKFKCKKCGYEISCTNKFIKKLNCPNCYLNPVKKINKNLEKYQDKLNLLNLNVTIIPEYFTSTVKLSKFKCDKCNNYFLGYVNNLLIYKSSSCPFCPKEKSLDIYKEKLKEINLENKYEILDDNFHTSKEKIKFLCKKCNTIFYKSLTDFFSNQQHCPECAKNSINKHYSNDELNNIVKKLNLEIVGTYINRRTITQFKCLECGNIINTTLSSIIDKTNRNNLVICFKCFNKNNKFISKFSGEQKIINFLIENKITDFEREKSFSDLYYKSKSYPLRFDFYFEKQNTVIEFNGIQHYKPIECFGGYKNFEVQKERDKLKKEYCKKNNINLIILNDENIEKIEKLCLSILTS